MKHNGGSNFAIFLLDDTGRKIELLVNEIGGFDGAKAVGVSKAGTYLLDISADGDWSVSVDQPIVSTAPKAPQKFTGKGQQVSPMFSLSSGLAIFRMTHDGRANFAIFLYDASGRRLDLLVNEIGPFDGSKAVRIGNAGIYILDITADGNWTVNIEQ
jgi:hypothetical protein